jgi:hypothetical protein
MAEKPVWLDEVIQIRRSIGDPVTGDFVYVDELPETAPQNTAYTTGSGEYRFHDGVEWRLYSLKCGDAYIRLLAGKHGRIGAAVKLIDTLIAQIDPADYLTGGNAGGQSMSFPSLQEVLDYYTTLRGILLEEEAAEAGMNSGLMLKTKKRPVGGAIEGYEDT